jgi:fatty-acyl-CoA synthase
MLNTRFRAAELAQLLSRARPAAVARDFPPVDVAAILGAVPAEARSTLRFAIGVGGLPEGRAGAFIIPGPGFDAEGLGAACAAQLARFKMPARIMPLTEFPTTDGPNGRKVQCAKWREMAGR